VICNAGKSNSHRLYHTTHTSWDEDGLSNTQSATPTTSLDTDPDSSLKASPKSTTLHSLKKIARVASYVTIRTLFALTALPMFTVLQYDVSVAFIESILNDNAPPIYCECADGYEDKSKFCYLLRRHLYGMRDSHRGYAKLFESICQSFHLTQLKTDDCVYVKIVNNQRDHQGPAQPVPPHPSDLSHLYEMEPDVPVHNRIYPDCAYPISILIVCSYVDDNLFFTNSTLLAHEFETHCNTRLQMTSEGPVNWYFSVKYDRCSITGAVSANQELHINKILQRWGMSDCHPHQPKRSFAISKAANPYPSHGVPRPVHHQPSHIYGYADASFADVKPERTSSMGYVFSSSTMLQLAGALHHHL